MLDRVRQITWTQKQILTEIKLCQYVSVFSISCEVTLAALNSWVELSHLRKKGTSFKRKQTLFAKSSTNFKKRWTILMRKIQSTRLKSSSSTSLIRKAMKLKTELMSVTNKCKRHLTSTTHPKSEKVDCLREQIDELEEKAENCEHQADAEEAAADALRVNWRHQVKASHYLTRRATLRFQAANLKSFV